MVELAGDLDLADEALHTERCRQFGTQHLERHGTVEPQVAREIHDSHPAAADLALDGIAVGQGRLEMLQSVCHVGRRRIRMGRVRIGLSGGACQANRGLDARLTTHR
jgi:hypothetical protein